MSENEGHHPTPTMLLLHRLLRDFEEQRTAQCEVHPCHDLSWFDQLSSHWGELDQTRLIRYAQVGAMVAKYMRGYSTERDAAHAMARLACNAVTISDEELRPRGKGLYMPLAVINHSCRPNAVIVHSGKRAILRGVRDVDAGCELTIAYVDVVSPARERRAEIESNYFFRCECERCLKADKGSREDMLLRAVRCPIEGCQGAIPDDYESNELRCTRCQATLGMHEARTKLSAASESRQEAHKLLDESDMGSALERAKEAWEVAGRVASRGSAALTRASECFMRACIDAGRFEEALEACQVAASGHRVADPEMCLPTSGLHYAAKAKLERHLGKLGQAIKSFKRAVSNLELSHGHSHALCRDLREQLEATQAEVAQTRQSTP